MSSQGIFLSLILNISMLFTISSLLTRIPSLQYLVMERWDKLGGRLMLPLIFSAVSILSTYTGVNVNGVIVNTRVIGVLAGGLIGGPAVGITVGIIAGLHRLFFVGGFTTYACALSCVLYGFICAAFYPHFVRGSWEGGKLFTMTLICETLHMSLILFMSHPFHSAVEAVRILALPMVILNALGTLMFLSNFTKTFREKDHESARNLKIALSIAQQCLPHLKRGLSSEKDMAQTVDIILSAGIGDEVIITDKERILSRRSKLQQRATEGKDAGAFPPAARLSMEKKQVITDTENAGNAVVYGWVKKNTTIAAPLIIRGEPVGSLSVCVRNRLMMLETDKEFIEGLSVLFSTQLELSQMEFQKKQLRKAEFKALQAQINPHFLYNALNAISCVCRENPDRARELLLSLAVYFREGLENTSYVVSLGDELKHLNHYLELEQARFEEDLQVSFDIKADYDCLVPSSILQPIVENAIKYGSNSQGHRIITIRAWRAETSVKIEVSDQGYGFPEAAVTLWKSGFEGTHHFGLANVDQRLKNICEDGAGIVIESGRDGSKVILTITEITEEMKSRGGENENSTYRR